MYSGNLTFLEPSGALQACNGTDLPFFLYMIDIKVKESHYLWVVGSVVVTSVWELVSDADNLTYDPTFNFPACKSDKFSGLASVKNPSF